jgi:hypothetical protein
MIYTLKQFPDKRFTDKMDQTNFIKKKLSELIVIKRAEYKTKSEPVIKAGLVAGSFTPDIEVITSDIVEVKAIINTTNVIDSHMDLHLQDIWNKTVKDNPFNPVLKQHENKFESVIANKAKNFNQKMNFKDIGVNIDFDMVANCNVFQVDKNKQPLMYDKYVSGEVEQHSVGMMYVDLDIAYYDESSQKEMDFFNDMLKQCINPEVAEESGYVWIIREAKKREGSAVVFASNSLTPTLYVKNYEPQQSTRDTIEPPTSTQTQQTKFINPNFY